MGGQWLSQIRPRFEWGRVARSPKLRNDPMLHLLVDTRVWLDLAKDYREQPVVSALEDLVATRQIKLVVPRVVLDEFSRNKGRLIEDARRSLQSHFRLVREAVNRFGEDKYRSAALAALNEVDHTNDWK
jgi:predicted nucleic acid-binding protein